MRFSSRRAAGRFASGALLLATTLGLSVTLAAALRPADSPPPAAYHRVVPALAGDSADAPYLALATSTPANTATPTATATATATATPSTGACGPGHASLATLSDAGAASLVREPQAGTAAALLGATRPASLPSTASRSAPIETAIYSLQVSLLNMTTGPNGEVRLAVQFGPGNSMLVVFPAKGCLQGATPEDQGAANGARLALARACGEAPTSGTKELRGTATLSGPGYWGDAHTAWAAANGVQLAPVLSFEYTDSRSCDPAKAGPEPTPTPRPQVTGILVGTDVLPEPGVPPGTEVHATAYIQPPISGVSCTPMFVTQSTVHDLPALGPKESGEDGLIHWAFTIPPDAPPDNWGRFTLWCDGGFNPTARVNVSQP